MRFCALLIFVGVMALTAADQFSRFKREITGRSDLFLRQKRSGLLDGLYVPSCEDDCDMTLIINVNNTGFEGTGNPFGFLSVNSSNLDAVCKQYEGSKACYDRCAVKSTSTSAFYQLLCEKEKAELLKHLPCYQKAENASESFCEAKCGSVDAMMNDTEKTINSTDLTDFASLGKIMEAMAPLCKFLECAISCGAELFTKECPTDPEAGTFFKDMSAAGATITLKDLNSLDATLGLHMMPNECRALAGPPPAASTDDEDDKSTILNILSKPDSGTGSMQQMLMEKQVIILDKTSRNLDAELEKINLEKKLLEKQIML